ncbi:MAG: multicopper oxidase family protein [Bryobacteraceae bacterium]
MQKSNELSKRTFLKAIAGGTAGLLTGRAACTAQMPSIDSGSTPEQNNGPADYTLHIGAKPIEIAPKKIISAVTYNGQFPGPLLRFKEGRQVTVDVFNDTDTPEQLHWHGQLVSTSVDGAAEEGTPFIPARGKRRLTFTPRPAGFRFYHTHNRAGANLSAGQYSGQVGPVYIEPKQDPGRYDRELFLVLKEFEPSFSQGGDMAQDFLTPATTVPELKEQGETAMKHSLAKGMPHGYEVGYNSFTINGRKLHHAEPIKVKQGERILFHVLNGSATEIRSLALPGHTFEVVSMDGNPLPTTKRVPVLWVGTAERISAIVEMNHPGVWILGDTADDDRNHGMGIVVEYAHRTGKAVWLAPPHAKWNYTWFGSAQAAPEPDETFDMTFTKINAADQAFNRWEINGAAYPNAMAPVPATFKVQQGKRYRLRMRNASDDIHPIHLHRHVFELTKVAGQPTSGIMKDVVMVGGYQSVEVDFIANNPGLTLFHCHQQLHMDYGFMTLFDYV